MTLLIELIVFFFFLVPREHIKSPFGKNYFCRLILLFNLFFLLFMSLTALFGTIHGFHYTISANFYLYVQYFQ